MRSGKPAPTLPNSNGASSAANEKNDESLFSSAAIVYYQDENDKKWKALFPGYHILFICDIGGDVSERFRIVSMDGSQKMFEYVVKTSTKALVKDTFVKWQDGQVIHGARFTKAEYAKQFVEKLSSVVSDITPYAKVQKSTAGRTKENKAGNGEVPQEKNEPTVNGGNGEPPRKFSGESALGDQRLLNAPSQVVHFYLPNSESTVMRLDPSMPLKDVLGKVCKAEKLPEATCAMQYVSEKGKFLDLDLRLSQLRSHELRIVDRRDQRKSLGPEVVDKKNGKEVKAKKHFSLQLFKSIESKGDSAPRQIDDGTGKLDGINVTDPYWQHFLHVANIHQHEIANPQVVELVEHFVSRKGGVRYLKQLKDTKMSQAALDDINDLTVRVQATLSSPKKSPDPSETDSPSHALDFGMRRAVSTDTLASQGSRDLGKKRKAPPPPKQAFPLRSAMSVGNLAEQEEQGSYAAVRDLLNKGHQKPDPDTRSLGNASCISATKRKAPAPPAPSSNISSPTLSLASGFSFASTVPSIENPSPPISPRDDTEKEDSAEIATISTFPRSISVEQQAELPTEVTVAFPSFPTVIHHQDGKPPPVFIPPPPPESPPPDEICSPVAPLSARVDIENIPTFQAMQEIAECSPCEEREEFLPPTENGKIRDDQSLSLEAFSKYLTPSNEVETEEVGAEQIWSVGNVETPEIEVAAGMGFKMEADLSGVEKNEDQIAAKEVSEGPYIPPPPIFDQAITECTVPVLLNQSSTKNENFEVPTAGTQVEVKDNLNGKTENETLESTRKPDSKPELHKSLSDSKGKTVVPKQPVPNTAELAISTEGMNEGVDKGVDSTDVAPLSPPVCFNDVVVAPPCEFDNSIENQATDPAEKQQVEIHATVSSVAQDAISSSQLRPEVTDAGKGEEPQQKAEKSIEVEVCRTDNAALTKKAPNVECEETAPTSEPTFSKMTRKPAEENSSKDAKEDRESASEAGQQPSALHTGSLHVKHCTTKESETDAAPKKKEESQYAKLKRLIQERSGGNGLPQSSPKNVPLARPSSVPVPASRPSIKPAEKIGSVERGTSGPAGFIVPTEEKPKEQQKDESTNVSGTQAIDQREMEIEFMNNNQEDVSLDPKQVKDHIKFSVQVRPEDKIQKAEEVKPVHEPKQTDLPNSSSAASPYESNQQNSTPSLKFVNTSQAGAGVISSSSAETDIIQTLRKQVEDLTRQIGSLQQSPLLQQQLLQQQILLGQILQNLIASQKLTPLSEQGKDAKPFPDLSSSEKQVVEEAAKVAEPDTPSSKPVIDMKGEGGRNETSVAHEVSGKTSEDVKSGEKPVMDRSYKTCAGAIKGDSGDFEGFALQPCVPKGAEIMNDDSTGKQPPGEVRSVVKPGELLKGRGLGRSVPHTAVTRAVSLDSEKKSSAGAWKGNQTSINGKTYSGMPSGGSFIGQNVAGASGSGVVQGNRSSQTPGNSLGLDNLETKKPVVLKSISLGMSTLPNRPKIDIAEKGVAAQYDEEGSLTHPPEERMKERPFLKPKPFGSQRSLDSSLPPNTGETQAQPSLSQAEISRLRFRKEHQPQCLSGVDMEAKVDVDGRSSRPSSLTLDSESSEGKRVSVHEQREAKKVSDIVNSLSSGGGDYRSPILRSETGLERKISGGLPPKVAPKPARKPSVPTDDYPDLDNLISQDSDGGLGQYRPMVVTTVPPVQDQPLTAPLHTLSSAKSANELAYPSNAEVKQDSMSRSESIEARSCQVNERLTSGLRGQEDFPQTGPKSFLYERKVDAGNEARETVTTKRVGGLKIGYSRDVRNVISTSSANVPPSPSSSEDNNGLWTNSASESREGVAELGTRKLSKSGPPPPVKAKPKRHSLVT